MQYERVIKKGDPRAPLAMATMASKRVVSENSNHG
jgi:hypothetical protein